MKLMFPLSSYHNLVVTTCIFVNLSSISVEWLMRESARDFSRWNRFDIVNHELSCWVTVVITHTQLSCLCVALARFKLYTPDWRFGSFTRNILDMRNGDRERTKLKPTKKREKKKCGKKEREEWWSHWCDRSATTVSTGNAYGRSQTATVRKKFTILTWWLTQVSDILKVNGLHRGYLFIYSINTQFNIH